jgi:hypothetical protein
MFKDETYVGNDIRLITVKELTMLAQSIMTSRGGIPESIFLTL